MTKGVITAASLITAITVMSTFIFRVSNFFGKLGNNYSELSDLLTKSTLYILKLAVLDRIHAGEQYIKLGANGLIKKKYEKLLEEYNKREVEEE